MLLLVDGDWKTHSEHLTRLIESGYAVVSADHLDGEVAASATPLRAGLIAAVASDADSDRAAARAGELHLRWLAWDCRGDGSLRAYRSGAMAVLPPDVSPADLLRAVSQCCPHGHDAAATFDEYPPRRCRAGDVIETGPESVVEIRAGAIAVRALHPDGAEALLGLFGPGEALLGPASGSGHVEVSAHADAEVIVRPGCDACPDDGLARRLGRAQITLTEWSAVQARPQVDRRVRGILRLLAERFGRDEPAGWRRIDLRVTHQQLADAALSTRSTVSRALRDLAHEGVVRLVGAGEYRRIDVRPDAVDSPGESR